MRPTQAFNLTFGFSVYQLKFHYIFENITITVLIHAVICILPKAIPEAVIFCSVRGAILPASRELTE